MSISQAASVYGFNDLRLREGFFAVVGQSKKKILINEGLMVVLRRQTNFEMDYKAAAAIESLGTSVLSISTHQTRLTIRLLSLKAMSSHSYNIFIGFGCRLQHFSLYSTFSRTFCTWKHSISIHFTCPTFQKELQMFVRALPYFSTKRTAQFFTANFRC